MNRIINSLKKNARNLEDLYMDGEKLMYKLEKKPKEYRKAFNKCKELMDAKTNVIKAIKHLERFERMEDVKSAKKD